MSLADDLRRALDAQIVLARELDALKEVVDEQRERIEALEKAVDR